MLDVIAEIGKAVSGGDQADLLEFLVPESVPQRYIVGIDFRLDERRIAFELLAEGGDDGLTKSKLMAFLYVPSEKGYRPQFSPTSPNLAYLVSQSLPNLKDFLAEDSDLRRLLDKVCHTFFTEVTDRKGKKALVLTEHFFAEVGVAFPTDVEKLKDGIIEYAKNIGEVIASQTGVPKKEIIYTACVNGTPIVKHPEYREFLLRKNTESAFEDTRKGPCAVCGQVTQLTQDTTRLTMKFYITDKINFASHFDSKNYFKAVALCSRCYQELIAGERWIQQHLKTRLGGFDLYVVPTLAWDANGNARSVLRKLERVTDDFNEVKNVKSLREAQKEAIEKGERLRLLEGNPFIFNLLFYRQSQSAFKILTLIRDVPPTRLEELARATTYVDTVRSQMAFPESSAIDLERVYWMIPLRKRGKDLQEYRKVLQLYGCLFQALPVHKGQLMRLYVELAKMHHFDGYGLYQISRSNDPEYSLMADTLRWNLFLLFLKYLNLIEGEKPMESNDPAIHYPDGVQEVFDRLGYTEAQRGLALLGYVIGVIAYAQYLEGLKNRPVLEKINYQGMSEDKVLRLFNDVFEKIRQYGKNNRTVSFSERWWASAQKLYEMGKNQKLTSDERVFYLLSGYSMNLVRAKHSDDSEPPKTDYMDSEE